jgi:hypothetical protein
MRFDLRGRSERRPAAEWREPHSAQGLPERPAEREPPPAGSAPASRALVRCAAVELGSVLERRELALCAAGSALEPALLRPRAAAVAATLSPAPVPSPSPAAVWQVPPVASAQQAALLPAVEAALLPAVEPALVVTAAVGPQAGGRAAARQVAVVAKVAQPAAVRLEAVRLEAPGAPVALPSVLPWVAASAFHRDQLPPWPAPRPEVWSARVMEPPRIAGL